MDNIININDYNKNLEDKINDIIRDSTYPELSRYLLMLPKDHDSEEDLFYWGFSYINEYYKIIGKLEKIDNNEIENIKYKIYILYLKEIYGDVILSYDEFITFSKLLNTTFLEYNPKKIRERDRNPFVSGDKNIDYIVNKIAKEVNHSPHPHAYEITKFKLDILRKTLRLKMNSILQEEIKDINLDDEVFKNTFSEKRIKELKKN